eukprot:TRINITY_DN5009_c0_g2_i1.p1 TRINITY_DN5009_c0_g2~~TRINITY_DN5009_c0_g2_i1.p1  ORF type:complete len:635 (-),score=156.83 TRINITY_DN5009_c0_g2_i1:219-2123(-)
MSTKHAKRMAMSLLLLLVALQGISCTQTAEEQPVLAPEAPGLQPPGEEALVEQKLITIDLKRREHTIENKFAMINLLAKAQYLVFNEANYKILSELDLQKSLNVHGRRGNLRRTVSSNGEEDVEAPSAGAAEKKVAYIPIRNYFNTQYTGEISVGSKENVFHAIFDTGSTNIWVNSIRCSDPGCLKHKQYDWRNSSTFTHMGVDVMVRFGSGILTGVINKEVVYLGDMQVKEQEFIEVIHQRHNVLNSGHYDAIVGMGLPRLAAKGFTPLFDNLMGQQILQQDVFTFALSREDGSYTSRLIFGGWDQSLLQGEIGWHPVESELYWAIKLDAVRIGDKKTSVCESDQCMVILDSGTSFMTVPSDKLRQLSELIHVSKKCQNFAELPTITFVIGGIDYSLDPWEYIITIKDENKVERPFQHSSIPEITHCAGLFMPLDLPGKFSNYWILGDVFMSKYVTIFDRANMKIGLSLSKNYKLIDAVEDTVDMVANQSDNKVSVSTSVNATAPADNQTVAAEASTEANATEKAEGAAVATVNQTVTENSESNANNSLAVTPTESGNHTLSETTVEGGATTNSTSDAAAPATPVDSAASATPVDSATSGNSTAAVEQPANNTATNGAQTNAVEASVLNEGFY